MIKRKIYSRVLELLKEFRIVYISGPRQAGKSTLAKEIAAAVDMKYFTLDNQSLLEVANSDPHGLLASLGKKIILDEFQYVPALIPAIKMVSDDLQPDEKGVFLLTGSSDIFKSARTREALPGHMASLELYPFSVSEVSNVAINFIDYLLAEKLVPMNGQLIDRQQMADILIRGGYPEASTKSTRNRSAWFKSYVLGRLYKDFAALTATRGDYIERIDSLSRLLAGMSGNLIKYANIANSVGFDDKTVKKYMQALELMFIIKTIKPYVKNRAKRSVLGLPKIHFVDTGLACHLLGIKKAETLVMSNYYGSLLENFVLMEIVKQSGWAEEETRLYHFRDKKKNEVDIVMERDDGKIIGIEIKASASVKQQDFKGLYEFELYGGNKFARGVLIYTGAQLLPMKYKDRIFYAVPISFLLGSGLAEKKKTDKKQYS
jgi:predicted AAA+ superfamily ATPase